MSSPVENPFHEEALSDEPLASSSHLQPADDSKLPTSSSAEPSSPPPAAAFASQDDDDAPLASAAYPFSAAPYPQDDVGSGSHGVTSPPLPQIPHDEGDDRNAGQHEAGKESQGQTQARPQQQYERPRRDAILVSLASRGICASCAPLDSSAPHSRVIVKADDSRNADRRCAEDE